MRLVLVLPLLLACGNKNATPAHPEEGTEAPAPPTEAVADADGEPQAPPDEAEPEPEPEPAKPTPESLYAECKDRVEGRQKEGECTTDADCKAAGCGSEVCTTVAEAAQVMTTCEARLCFKVLDTCGCHDGMCTWTLKEQVPDLPPTPPPEDGG